jgi:hypothetical protein
MRYVLASLAFLICMSQAACSNTPTSGVYYAQAPAEKSVCGCAAEAGAPGPLMIQAGGAPMLGAQYSVGPTDYIKAGAMIPAEAVVCVGNFARCLTNVFFPTPTPSLGYVNVIPVQQMIAAPEPKAACAPPPPPPPVMQRAPMPVPRRACPEPVTAVCNGESCQIHGR